jgi:glucokinase
MTSILAADIGGTSSRFVLFESGGRELRPVERLTLDTAKVQSFADLLEELRGRGFVLPGEASRTAIAVAGAVSEGRRCTPPNIPWDIDLDRDLPEASQKNVVLVNDFAAQAYATRTLPGEQALVVRRGRVVEQGAVAVIGAGTGLGQCALVGCRDRFTLLPSEGGHTAFAFREEEATLHAFLLSRVNRGYCRQEDVVSGNGLSLVHEFLSGERLAPQEVSARLDRSPETAALFARLYGRVARQYVLQVLAWGGLYLAGGVAVKNPGLVQHAAFAQEFTDCAEYARLLGDVPVRLMVDEQSGVYGAAFFALHGSGCT